MQAKLKFAIIAKIRGKRPFGFRLRLIKRGEGAAHSITSYSPSPVFSCATFAATLSRRGHYSRYSWPIIYITSFAGVRSCQLERDSWCDGCYLFFGRYPGSTGPEVGSLSLHAAADHDTFGFSACHGPKRGAHSSSSIFGRIGSSSCYRPTTTTVMRWLGFFYDFV